MFNGRLHCGTEAQVREAQDFSEPRFVLKGVVIVDLMYLAVWSNTSLDVTVKVFFRCDLTRKSPDFEKSRHPPTPISGQPHPIS